MQFNTKAYINNICDALQIKTPRISNNGTRFATNSTLAYLNSAGTVLYIRKELEQSNICDFAFSIAHELRHKWQLENNESLYFDEYKPASMLPDLEAYNLQLAEIDANAFACIMLFDTFGKMPTFPSLTDRVRHAINMRIDYLIDCGY